MAARRNQRKFLCRSRGPAEAARGAGFTLLEMVIAVAIFGLMGVMAFTGLNEMTRNGQKVGDANDRLSDLQFAVVYMVRDWTQVSPRRIRNQYGDEEHNIVIEDDTITFTRSGWSNLLGRKRSSLQRVQYRLVDNQLRRLHWPSLDQGIGEEPVAVAMLDDVESMEIVFQNAQGQAIRNWPPDGDSSEGQPILLAIRLELSDIGEITRLLEIPDGVL